MKVKITNVSRPRVEVGMSPINMIGNLQGDIQLNATICVIGDSLQPDYHVRCVNTSPVTAIVTIGSNIKRVLTETGLEYEIEEIK